MFEAARLKLTVWYLLIIMAISLFFSAAIYANANNEFLKLQGMRVRILESSGRIGLFEKRVLPIATRIDPEIIDEARSRFILRLGLINIGILITAGFASYFLAGITLDPIRKSLEEHKRFISDASHELRTPLTSLRSEIEVALRNKKMTTSEAKKILGSNLEEVISIQKLSDNLLELAQNGKLIDSKNMMTLSIISVIQAAIKKLDTLAKKKKIKFINKVSDIKIRGVEDRLTELFVILLDNAVKYSPANSSIEISSQKKTRKVEISVTDYGVGIDEKDLPFIFERFYRADKSRSEEGYGLGLSIAKKIVESHGGTISVESIPDKKTTVRLLLPL